jgi:CheY-like chemotaxis protein
MRVLVVDDHKEFRDEVVTMLTRNGHQAEGAVSATAAIPLAQSGRFDLVLVDYSMPQHDGIWFMENVRLPRGTKAVLVTAHVYREMIKRMFRLGVAGYIIKPFGESDLLRQLSFHYRGDANAGTEGNAVASPNERRNEQPQGQEERPCGAGYRQMPETVQPPVLPPDPTSWSASVARGRGKAV